MKKWEQHQLKRVKAIIRITTKAVQDNESWSYEI